MNNPNLSKEMRDRKPPCLRILIVEDDLDDIYLVKQLLLQDERREYEITHKENLSSALLCVNQQEFDIILLDLGLGEIQGLDTLNEMLAGAPAVPVIVLTGINNDAVGEDAIKLGAEDYLPKSEINPSLLSRTLSYAIERHSLRLQLQLQAQTDILTGLPNRSAIFEKLEHAVDHSNRKTSLFAVAMLDLDGFKQVNDNLGHRAGDELLRQVATRLRKELRRTDFAGRLGGDEFILLLHHYKSTDELLSVLEKKRAKLIQPMKIYSEKEIHVVEIGVSVGVVEWHAGGSAQQLMSEADRAMYRSKHEGKNRITLSKPELKNSAT
ncbi:response regulator receiver modulated diguanylate cyclase [Alteromonadaceae bacterium Bs31]|nr:response regulator receiver modulated diguanylate cyclase [Alteromonadaceae bacterium Bs31]